MSPLGRLLPLPVSSAPSDAGRGANGQKRTLNHPRRSEVPAASRCSLRLVEFGGFSGRLILC